MPGFFINMIDLDNKTGACTRVKEQKKLQENSFQNGFHLSRLEQAKRQR